MTVFLAKHGGQQRESIYAMELDEAIWWFAELTNIVIEWVTATSPFGPGTAGD